MRQTVSEANKYLRQTVKSVEAGGVATLAQAMEHPGTLQEVHVTTLDAADAEIPEAAGLSEGVKLPTRIETKKLVIVGKFPIATQAEYDALSDAMKDKAVLLTVDECPIGSEVKAIECDALGVPVDAHMWVMGLNGWKGGSSSTLNPDGSTSFAGPVRGKKLVIPRMDLGPNRITPVAIPGKYVEDDGSEVSLAGFGISDWIPCLPGERLFVCGADAGSQKRGVYYTADRTYVSAIFTSTSSVNGMTTVPANCYWMRVNIRSAGASWGGTNYVYLFEGWNLQNSARSISAMGDSIAFGTNTQKPFWRIFAEKIGATETNNHGIASSTVASPGTSPMSGRMSSIVVSDINIFLGGGNDKTTSIPLGTIADTANTTFYGGLNICAKWYVENAPFSKNIWVKVPRWSTWATANAVGLTMDDYMEAFEAVARRNGFQVVDAYNRLSIANWPRILSNDFGHPNDSGSEILAALLLEETFL